MSGRADLSRFARMDPAHVLDGLWVPVAKKGEALYDVKGSFHVNENGIMLPQIISFEGVQLTARHQSVLLAISARTGRMGRAPVGQVEVAGTGTNLLALQRSLMDQMDLTGPAQDKNVSLVRCTAYALLQDAGMEPTAPEYKRLLKLLQQMQTVTMSMEYKGKGGSSNLLSYRYDEDKIVISLNWRMADSILGSQNIRVSLQERLQLNKSPVAKILHAWLSAHIREGGKFMAGRGVELDTLLSHVWGKRPVSDAVRRQRKNRLREALDDIGTLRGWAVSLDGSHAYINRPKLLEKENDPTPGEHAEIEVRTDNAFLDLWDGES